MINNIFFTLTEVIHCEAYIPHMYNASKPNLKSAIGLTKIVYGILFSKEAIIET